jgi:hypothetical protein
MPVMMYTNRQSSESEDVTASQRKRALSLNSFHTANFDQTSLFSSNRSHEV